MTQKKTEYLLYTPGCIQSRTPLIYKYGHVEGIELTVRKTGFCVKIRCAVSKSPENILDDNLFRDAIKKAELVQLLEFGRCSEIAELCIDINDQSFTVYDAAQQGNLPLVYSMCGYTLKRAIAGNWSSPDVLQTIIGTPKSRYDRRFSALFALLMARSKEYEAEKFMYLWMAMNGLYGYIAEEAKKTADKNTQEWLGNEFAKQKFLTLLHGYRYKSPQEDVLRYSIETVCKELPLGEIDDAIHACYVEDTSHPFVVKIKEKLSLYDLEEAISPYMLMLIWIPYKIRCKYFHAENALPVLCFSEEHPLPALRVVNKLLEQYLENNLPQWFSKELLDNILIPTVQTLAAGCECNKKGFLIQSSGAFTPIHIEV